MEEVRHAYTRCLEDRASGQHAEADGICHSDHAIAAYVLSATALEAFVHEMLALSPLARTKLGIEGEEIDRLDVRAKYLLLPRLLWGKGLTKGAEPFQSLDVLIRLRNEVVHYKMTPYPLGSGPAVLRDLSARHVLLPGEGWTWVQAVSTTSGALWAHNVACKAVRAVIGLAPSEEQEVLMAATNNFEEIKADATIDEVRGRRLYVAVHARLQT